MKTSTRWLSGIAVVLALTVIPGAPAADLNYCGNQDVYIVMEQVSTSSPAWSKNNNYMWLYNNYMDLYRAALDDGGWSWNFENEFGGFPSDSELHDAWNLHWGPETLGMTAYWWLCECCRIRESDVVFNPAFSWTHSRDAAEDDSGLVFYDAVLVHELGHTWGMQMKHEDYNYSMPTVMHAYADRTVQDEMSLHVPEAWAIRRNYSDQTSVLPLLNMGVFSKYANGTWWNSTIDDPSYHTGEQLTVRNVTIENTGTLNANFVAIQFYLSADRTITSSDYLIGGGGFIWLEPWPSETYGVYDFENMRIPGNVPAGTYYVGAIVTVEGGGDDLYSDQSTHFFDTVEIFGNLPPVADAGPDQTIECTGDRGAWAWLDGSGSTDADSTSGTNDDIVEFEWSESGSPIGSGEVVSERFGLGVHDVVLTVTDRAGASSTDAAVVTVVDTTPPLGGITSPPSGACFGAEALPVTVKDDFTDSCDVNVTRSYDPAPGPSYLNNGDYHVILTVQDSSGNTSAAVVDFTIDTVPPVVTILKPGNYAYLVPSALPMGVFFRSSDEDGATGGAVHEVMTLAGCRIYDGATYGDGDGLLSDEMIQLTQGELCRLAALCGWTRLDQPELRVEVTDCGSNASFASLRLRGGLKLLPGICGP